VVWHKRHQLALSKSSDSGDGGDSDGSDSDSKGGDSKSGDSKGGRGIEP
jgi:hypothetical protein